MRPPRPRPTQNQLPMAHLQLSRDPQIDEPAQHVALDEMTEPSLESRAV